MTGSPTIVYLESGAKRVFACAIDWPGWCRFGRDEARALEARRAAPAELRKGPRGGGRDRDAIADHVLRAEAA